jgi:hypothetical protein
MQCRGRCSIRCKGISTMSMLVLRPFPSTKLILDQRMLMGLE